MALYVMLSRVQLFVSQHKIFTEIIPQKCKYIWLHNMLFLLQKHIYLTENMLNY